MRKFTAAIALTIGLLVAPITAFAGPPDASWEKKFDEDRITIYTKKFSGKQYASYFAETIIDAPLQTVIDTLSDAGNMHTFVDKFRETTVLSQPSETEYVLYMVMKTPPLNDRDMVQHGRLEYVNDKEVIVHIDNKPDAHPEQDGRTRIRDMEQQWTAKELEDGRTLVTQKGYTDPDVGWLVRGMVDDRLPSEIYDVLSDVRNQVEATEKAKNSTASAK